MDKNNVINDNSNDASNSNIEEITRIEPEDEYFDIDAIENPITHTPEPPCQCNCSQPVAPYSRAKTFIEIAALIQTPPTLTQKNKINNKENKEEHAQAPADLPSTGCCCPCYNAKSTDARCCGACYFCCPLEEDEFQCSWVPSTFTEYRKSGYIVTHSNGRNRIDSDQCLCTIFCFPIKFSLFFPCFIGSIINSCFNAVCYSNYERNYIC